MTVRAPSPGAAITERERVLSAFLDAHGEAMARACLAMARALARGGAVIAFGAEAAGARRTGRPGDVAVSVAPRAGDPEAAAFLAAARRDGLLTVALEAGEGRAVADHVLVVPSGDGAAVREVQTMAYQALCELVHVFLDRPGLLDEACITCGDVAVEADVVEVTGTRAIVERAGAREEIAVDLVDDVRVGDRLLCHAGVALERLARADQAADTPSFVHPLGGGYATELEAALDEVRSSIAAMRRPIDLDAVAAAAAGERP